MPVVQKKLLTGFLTELEKSVDGRLEVDGIKLQPFDAALLSGVRIIDTAPMQCDKVQDTLFRASKIYAEFSLRSLFGDKVLRLGRARIEDGMMALVIEPGQYNNNLSRIFRITPKQNKEPSQREVFHIGEVEVRNFEYRMLNLKNTSHKPKEYGIDWMDMSVTADGKGHSLGFADGIMSFAADDLSMVTDCGYRILHASGHGRVGRGVTLIEDFRLIDDFSDIDLTLFKMSYSGNKAFKHFTDEVRMDAKFRNSRLGVSTISAFGGFNDISNMVFDIGSGSISGPVSDLTVSNLKFTETSSGIGVSLDGGITGLPDIKASSVDIDLHGRNITFAGVEGINMDLSGNGLLDDMAVKATLNAGNGSMNTNIRLKGLISGNTGIKGIVSTTNIDAGRLSGMEMLGNLTMNAGLEAKIKGSDSSVRLDSLHVEKIGLLGYEYSDLQAAGTFDKGSFNGRVVCRDPNLNFMLQGIIHLKRTSSNAAYNFMASIGYADLHAINLDPRPVSKFMLNNLRADFVSGGKGDLSGNVSARGIRLESQEGNYDIGDINLKSTSRSGNYSMSLESSFLDGKYEGSTSIISILDEIKRASIGRELSALMGEELSGPGGQSGSLDLSFHDSRNLLAFVMPGLYIADSTHFTAGLNTRGILTGKLTSPRIAFKDKYLRRMELELDNRDSALNCKLNTNEASLLPAMNFNNGSLILYANDNNLGLGCYYHNDDDNRADIYLTADLSNGTDKGLVVNAKSLTSNIYLDGEKWSIRPAEVRYSDKMLNIDNFCIENGIQSIVLDGGLSGESSDTLSMELNAIDLANLNTVLAGKYELEGKLTGEALIISPLDREGLGISARLNIEDCWLGGYSAGYITAESQWNEMDRSIDLSLSSHTDGKIPISVTGSIYPSNGIIAANAVLDEFEAGYFSPLASGIFSRIEGGVSGNISIGGTLDRLEVECSNGSIRNGILGIDYTGVPYYLDGPFSIDSRKIDLEGISIRDGRNGKGTASGGILHDHFKNMTMDTHLVFEDMECTRITEQDGEAFYGNLYGTGRLSFSGPFNSLSMDGDITTSSQGRLHIPLGATTSSDKAGLLSFKEQEKFTYLDPYEQMMMRIDSKQANKGSLGMRFKIAITPAVDINLEIDKSSGHEFSGRGNGTVTLDIRPARDIFTINGDYTLNSGDYHFAALGIANRDFSVQEGSSVKFNGDLMDSDLDIDAQYITKTSLSNLIADTTSVSNRRNVECGVHISDKLRNPALAFSINIPDLDPITKSRVESALNTEDKIQKQFVALLISNNFLPDEQSGVTNNSANMLFSNMAEIMSNQLNNILQKLDIPLDLGLNYQSTQGGMNIFDVAISTQLFNNRAIINGTIGNRQYGSSSNEDVVGDIDIEIKLDKSGQLRLSLFSHSADDYTNYLDNSQRSGVGVAYQKEFNRLREFLRRIVMSRRKREAEDLAKALQTEERTIIKID